MNNQNKIILETKSLKKYFPLKKDIFGNPLVELKAVDDVSFTLEAGKTIGVVGESGCGKTTLGRTILQLYDTTGGKSLYYGHTLEEFMPFYYINGIKKLPTYRAQYIKLKVKLNNLVNGFEKYVSLGVKDVTLSMYEKALEEVREEINNLNSEVDKELIKKLELVKKTIKSIVFVLENSAIYTGGLILSNHTQISNLSIKKLQKEHELVVKNDRTASESDNITADIENINKELVNIKSEISEKSLFTELENKIERGLDLAKLKKKEMRSLRTEIQLIFQDPYSSLPPRMTIGAILTEPVKVHNIVPKEKVSEHVRKIMKMCGLQPQYYDRYPHEFSGGQRQRICIARALVVNPKLVICDEPVSALDVSIQAQIINLLKDLQKELGLTYMFISHDLSVVKYITDSIIVMYLGNMMEIGDTNDIFDNPLHPYTKALFSAVPIPDPDAKMNRIILKGDIPSPANPPKGCKFHTRCEKCMAVCEVKAPKFIKYGENHFVACHLYDEEVMNDLQKYEKKIRMNNEKR